MAQRVFCRKVYQESKTRKRLFLIPKIIGVVFFLALSGIFLVFIYYAKDLPRPEKFAEKQFIQSTKIYDRTGQVLLYELYGEEKRTIVPLATVPEHLKQAVIVAEDANFYQHFGLDMKGIVRALLTDLKLWKPAQGGSTIPQQLIRSSLLSREKTLRRKIREIILTLELSRRYSKEQILGWYLNQVPFGSNAYGVEAASQTFFNKPVKNVSLAEAAALAAMIQAPSRLSPYGENIQELLGRKDYILGRMAGLGYISQTQAQNIKKEELKFSQILQPIKAPHFVMYIKKMLIEKYGEDFLQEKGLKVYTSLDWDLQELAEKTLTEYVEQNEAYNAFNAAFVALDPKTGEILAMVGSKDWFAVQSFPLGCTPGKDCLFDPKINVALQPRQPGSAFKPFVYARAFQKGYTPDTVVWDVQTNFGVWGAESYIPQNYDGKFRGPVTLRQALGQSLNVPSVKVLYLSGVEESIKLAKSAGITTLNEPPSFYGLSLVLGGGDVKLLDMVSAYGVFATEGLLASPRPIVKIEDSQGQIIEENKKTAKRVLPAEICRLISDILSDNEARTPIFGPNSSLYIEGYPVAAKTGTNEGFKDGWIIGYTSDVVAGAWVGNNNASPMDERPAAVAAGPIWNKFMREVIKRYPAPHFAKPQPVITDKPVLNGQFQGHSILYFVNKDNPQGPAPENPAADPQYLAWEQGILNWALNLRKE